MTEKDHGVGALVAALAKKKAVVKLLRPGADAAALAALEAAGAPPALRALLAAHDGSTDALLGAHRLLSAAEVLEERAAMSALAAREGWPATRWSPAWLPIFADGDGQLLAIDPVGGVDDGPAGQIVAYDHETGPARELASLDVLGDLLTTLAKKGLAGGAGAESEAFEAAYAKAQAVGLAKMPPKELKKLRAKLDAWEGPLEDKLALVEPVARKFGAELELWAEVATIALELRRAELAVLAAERAVRLTPTRDRPRFESTLVLALHRAGRDEAALAALRAAFALKTNYPESLVPLDAAPAFLARAFAVGTEVRPKSYKLWLERGRWAAEPAARAEAFQAAIALTRDPAVVGFNDGIAARVRAEAERLLALDDAYAVTGPARLDRLVALSEREAEAGNQDTWRRLTTTAIELGAWDVAARAGERAMATAQLDYQRYAVAAPRLRALVELGREDEALAVLDDALRAMIFDQDRAEPLVAIPEGVPEDFRARALATAAAALDENALAWLGVAKTTGDAAARAHAVDRVLALTTDAALAELAATPGRPAAWNEERARHAEALRAARAEAEALRG